MSEKYRNLGAWLGIAIVTFLYLQLVLLRYDNLRNGIDLGTYTQLAHNLVFGQEFPPYNSILGKVAWGDHAHFIMTIIAPLYALVPSALTLLVIQLLAITTSGWAIYRIAQDVLKNYLYSYSMLIAYLLFFGVQYALDFDFHANVFTAALLAWMLWAFHFKKWPAYWIFFGLTLATREDAPLFCVMFGIYVLLFRGKKMRLIGVLTTLLAAAYFFFVVYYLMPLWEPTKLSLAYFDIDTPSKQPLAIAKAILGSPITMLQNMFDSSVKIRTMNNLFASFSYLSLASPLTYLMAVPNFIARFLSGEPQRWEMKLHYSVSLVPILAYGAILGTATIARVTRRIPGNKYVVSIAAVLLLISTYMVSIQDLDLPLHSLRSERRALLSTQSEDAKRIAQSLVQLLPAHSSISTISSFVPLFSMREKVYNFPEGADADFVVLSNQFTAWPLSRKDINTAIHNFRNNPQYSMVVEHAGVFVYKKIPTITVP